MIVLVSESLASPSLKRSLVIKVSINTETVNKNQDESLQQSHLKGGNMVIHNLNQYALVQ